MHRLKRVQRVGRGAFASAELCYLHSPDTSVSQPVVVKRLLPHVATNSELKRFVEEALLAKSLKHR